MPNIKSAIKRVKVARARALKNASARSALRTTIKRFEEAVVNNVENASQTLTNAIKALDKSASKGLIHKNTAARKKSRLMKRLNKTAQ